MQIDPEFICDQQANGTFPLFVPLPFLQRMEKQNPADPLLRQVAPVRAENQDVIGFQKDPLLESTFEVSPGLLKKYDDRVLLVTHGACAVHCRYCFRRNFPYETTPKSIEAWRTALNQIQADTSISEVILSGGDPLMLVDDMLRKLIDELATIRHINRLRIHTRLPIVIPQRVTDELVDIITNTRLATVVVIHANHANELDDNVGRAIADIRKTESIVLNQSVLLRSINDSATDLINLSQKLVGYGVIPYYLHQLDRVSGAKHYEVPVSEGKKIISEMRARVSGYLVPRYAHEIPGRTGKTIIL